jgi:hypothetical protein
MAMGDSVTVSMAEERIGILREMLRLRRLDTSASEGTTSE